MKYQVVKTNVTDPSINSAEWERANVGYVGTDRWEEYCKTPETSFSLLQGPEGISLLMKSNETSLRAECTEENGTICCDSCMEFFFKPDAHDTRYLNFEINPKGVLHLGLGSGRENRILLFNDRSIFNIETCVQDNGWALKLYIPNSFLGEIFKKVSPVCKGNFYKCGDMTDHIHYGAWSEVFTEKPDFHVPDFFGMIEF